jgi:hypothetical protein
MDDDTTAYVTQPTRRTLFLRTFLPWQLWRFAVINLKMIGIIRRSHRSHLPQRPRRADDPPHQSPTRSRSAPDGVG